MSELLYSIGQNADCAYLLRGGEIEYQITDTNRVRITGNGIIIGASEILLSMSRKEPVPRHASLVRVSPETQLNAIPAAKLASFITTYAIGFSVAHHIAVTITRLHPLLADTMGNLTETERYTCDLARLYVESLKHLEHESEDKNFPWLFSLIEKGKETEAYTFGLSISDTTEEKKIDVALANLSQYRQVYPKGTVICKEGEKAEEMFILADGKIEVRVKNLPVDIISSKSAIIGEMGLILGQPRTATLRALNNCNIIRINARDMESIFKNDSDTFFNMLSSLAIRERMNCERIREYSRKAGQTEQAGGEFTRSRLDTYAREYAAFAADMQTAVQAHPEMTWIEDLNELLQRRSTGLLSQAGTVTGELYLTQARQQEEMPPAPPPQAAPDETVLNIDWS